MAEDAHGADAHGEAAAGGLPQFDFDTWAGQIFWMLIAFGVLYWMLKSSLLPKIGGVIEERRDKIADDLDDASRMRAEAETAQVQYEQALANARAKAQSIGVERKAEVEAEVAQLARNADAEDAAKVTAAQARIEAAAQDAMSQVRLVAAETASVIVETLTGATPKADSIDAAAIAATASGTER